MGKFNENQFEFEHTARRGVHKAIIEAMLFVSGEPLALRDIAINLEVTPKYVEKLLGEMMMSYEVEERGIAAKAAAACGDAVFSFGLPCALCAGRPVLPLSMGRCIRHPCVFSCLLCAFPIITDKLDICITRF